MKYHIVTFKFKSCKTPEINYGILVSHLLILIYSTSSFNKMEKNASLYKSRSHR